MKGGFRGYPPDRSPVRNFFFSLLRFFSFFYGTKKKRNEGQPERDGKFLYGQKLYAIRAFDSSIRRKLNITLKIMKLDIKKAFLSPFRGDKWLQNLTLGCLLFGFSQILIEMLAIMPYKVIASIIGFLITFVLFGYLVQTSHNEINSTNNLSLNCSSCLRYLKYGLYVHLPAYLYTFLLYWLFFPLIVYFIRLLIRHSFSYEIATVIPLSIVGIISYSIFFPYISAILAQDFRLKDCFKISNLLLSIKKASSELLKSIGISLFLFVPYIILNLINVFYLNEKFKIAFLVLPIYLIIYNLYAQTYKIARQKF